MAATVLELRESLDFDKKYLAKDAFYAMGHLRDLDIPCNVMSEMSGDEQQQIFERIIKFQADRLMRLLHGVEINLFMIKLVAPNGSARTISAFRRVFERIPPEFYDYIAECANIERAGEAPFNKEYASKIAHQFWLMKIDHFLLIIGHPNPAPANLTKWSISDAILCRKYSTAWL